MPALDLPDPSFVLANNTFSSLIFIHNVFGKTDMAVPQLQTYLVV